MKDWARGEARQKGNAPINPDVMRLADSKLAANQGSAKALSENGQ
jgi:hypothetical protein